MIVEYGARWVLISKFCEVTGYTEKAVNQKICKGHFIKGIHWKNAPDGRRMMNMEAYDAWVDGETVYGVGAAPSRSTSDGRASGAGKP